MKKPAQHLIAEVPRRQTRVDITIGIDLGDVWSHYCTVNVDGEVIDRGRFRTSPRAIEKWFIIVPHARVAMEVHYASHDDHQAALPFVEMLKASPAVKKISLGVIKPASSGQSRLGSPVEIRGPTVVSPFDHIGQSFQRNVALEREAPWGRALKELSAKDPAVCQSDENLCALKGKAPWKIRYVGLPLELRFQGELS